MTPAHVLAARSYLGTRWRHRGRKPGRWLDCIGMLACAFQEAGRPIRDREVYGREADRDQLRQALVDEFGPALPKEDAREGDVGLFRGRVYPLHVGFITNFRGGLGLLHASNWPGVGKVVEHELASHWAARLIEVYRPGVFDGRP